MSDDAVNYLHKGASRMAKGMKVMAWFMIIFGIPMIFVMGIGFIFIGLGIYMLKSSKKMFSKETIENQLDGISAVASRIKRGSES